MIIKTLKARILRVLKSSLPTAGGTDGDADSSPPSPTKPTHQFNGDALSDDASFFDAHEPDTPPPPTTKSHGHRLSTEPLDAWELVNGNQADDDDHVPRASEPSDDADDTLLLEGFPARCPPGGDTTVVLYTTTLRGVRRTFEDCNGVRALLDNLGLAFQERDVSMDRGLRDQLWEVTGEKGAVPPRLFVRGRDVGGAAQVLALHEEGRLVPLLGGGGGGGETKRKLRCGACGGLRFVVCGECDGSCKVLDGGRCLGCNENGLVMCPLCL